MLHGIDSLASMNRELAVRCQASGLVFDCGVGGAFNSSIAVIAEAPGPRETQAKQPLVGGSGKFLWDTLRRWNIFRNQVYISNVVKRQLVSASDSKADPRNKSPIRKPEYELYKQLLLDELSWLPNLQYVVCLGNYALDALTGHIGIEKWRGSVLDTEIQGTPVKVVVAYNPAYIMREPKQEIVFRMDLDKLHRVMEGSYHVPQITAIINPTAAEAIAYTRMCAGAGIPISADIETMAGETACVGLAASDREGMCINFRTQTANRYTLDEERDVRFALHDLFSDPKVRFVAQNAHFDSSWMWYKDRIRWHAAWFDTMLAHHLLYPVLPHNLGFLTAQYTDHPFYKDDGANWREEGNIDDFWRYNVKDVCITRMVMARLHAELREQKMEAFFFDHVMRLQPHLVRMTVGGMKADTTLKARLTQEFADDVARRREEFVSACRIATGDDAYDCNPRSPRDLGRLFFNDLRLVGRGASSDNENRRRMRSHPRTSDAAKVVLDRLDEYLKEAKFLSTYIDSDIDEDGRWRCEWKQTGVQSAPGRLSSAQTMWGSGMNMQNQPERAKVMFLADDGYELSYFDMAQIEARLVAYLANISTWQEQFERARLEPGSYDAHCALASQLYGVPLEDVPKADFIGGVMTIRYKAKRARHGLNYRMAAPRLAVTAGLPDAEATRLYFLYHKEHPEIKQWWDGTREEVRKTGVLFSPLGRRWLLMQRFDDDALDAIIAFRPQSTAGDHVASVIYKCERDPRWPTDARFLLNIHDALIAINRPADGPVVRGLMRLYAEQPITINGREVIVPADFAVSTPDEYGVHKWSTLTKLKNVTPLPALPPLN